ncbi:MAG: hypothetical protein KatS3mg095_0781 [Candidatus Parcubacteria bacterium]|nr:MAG: hypothetical protein KatS3mg095_0781 [Candidatus Parcubacteria bacterium]
MNKMMKIIKIILNKNILLVFLILLAIFFDFLFKEKIKANIIHFYPQNCLGSFTNPEKAQGEPEVGNFSVDPRNKNQRESASDYISLINESNSAVYLGGFKEIYCGNFEGPGAQGAIKKITLHFNWIVTKERREAPIIEPTSIESESNILEKIIPPKTIEIIPNTTPTETTPLLESTSTPEATSIPQSSFNNANLREPYYNSRGLLPHVISINRQNTFSLRESVYSLQKSGYSLRDSAFFKFVFAEETSAPTESSTPITSESLSTPSNDTQSQSTEDQSTTPASSTSTENQITTTTPTESDSEAINNLSENSNTSSQTETSTENLFSSTTSTPDISTTTASTPPKTLFEIYYTLDGENWNYLGSIKEDEVLNAVPGSEFTLLPGINWLDISKIQIKINSLPDTDYYLYLESMWFEVEYELPQATSTISEITSFIGGTINSLTENLNTTSTSSEATTTSEEENDNEEENDEESTTTETELQNITTTPQIEVSPIKQRKYAKQIKIQNPDNISCKVEPFSIEIKEEETKTANLILSGKGIKNVEIGSLPTGIDIRVVEQSTLPDKLNNADDGTYEIQTSKDIVQLKIYRQKGSDKGNLTLPIIFSSGNSMIICQINVIAF